MTTSTRANNRALTLAGANKMFEAIGVEIFHHHLNYYHCDFLGRQWQAPTLTELCQSMLRHLADAALLHSLDS